jgi:hypothetical protein
MESMSAPASHFAHLKARKIGFVYLTALGAAFPLAVLDGTLAAAVGDLPLGQPLDLVRFPLFIAGVYVLVALCLATLEIPFVMLLQTSPAEEDRAGPAAKGYAAGVALALALLPLEPLAEATRESFARTAFAGLALALAGLGLALGALLVYAVLERLLARALARIREREGAHRVVASPAAGIVTPVLVIAAWAGLTGAEILEPGAREGVSLAGLAVALITIQGALAYLVASPQRRRKLVPLGLLVALFSVFSLGALADATFRAPRGDPALEGASQQTLLGSFLLPVLRRALRAEERPPAITPPAMARRAGKRPGPEGRGPALGRASRPPLPVLDPVRPPVALGAAVPAASVPSLLAAQPLPPHPEVPAPAVRPGRNLLLVTFDAFDPEVVALPEATALQEVAARAFQTPILAPELPERALQELVGEGPGSLGLWLSGAGYETVGLQAWNAKGRGRLVPAGFHKLRLVGGDESRNAADTAIYLARAFLRSMPAKPWCLWLHLPGPSAKAPVARKAAAQRAGLRLGWLLREIEKSRVEERTIVAVVGITAPAGHKAAGFLVVPGRPGERGGPQSLAQFGARLRAAVAEGR